MVRQVSEGPLTHRLMQARELTVGRDELAVAQQHIDAALLIVRRVHRGQR